MCLYCIGEFFRKIVGRGRICSTDNFFVQNFKYCFDPSSLCEAHNWNKEKGRVYLPMHDFLLSFLLILRQWIRYTLAHFLSLHIGTGLVNKVFE